VPFLEVRICARSCTHTPIDILFVKFLSAQHQVGRHDNVERRSPFLVSSVFVCGRVVFAFESAEAAIGCVS
jgi:hypothetical protein